MIDVPPINVAIRTFSRLGSRKRSDVNNFRDRQVRAVVSHAYAKVPFYRRLYDEHGVNPSKVRGVGDLPLLPRVSKHDLQRVSLADRVAEGVDISTLHLRRTTGTTGEPLTLLRSHAELRVLGFYYFQAFRSLGVRRTDLAAGIRLPRPGEPYPKYSLMRRLANRARVYPVADVIAADAADTLAAFKRLRPEIVGGGPGRLSFLAATWPDADKQLVKQAKWPRMIVVGGERLTQQVRNHLTEIFAAPVFDMYSNEEFGLIASQCPKTGEYHVIDESVALEILDGDRHVEPGESGLPVMTGLHGFSAPMIRYEVSDVLTLGKPTCDCGAALTTLGPIGGRSIDFFELPDGSVYTSVKIEEAIAFSSPWTRQIQVEQLRRDTLSVTVAPMKTPPADGAENTRRYLEEFLGGVVKVEVTIDPALGPRQGEAKFRSTIPLSAAEPTTQ